MYLLFVTSPNPATPSHLSLFALSLFPFSSLFALVCVCTYVYVCECVWLCECEFHCFLLYLCNFRVVVFLRQLFGAPFFKTNHKHHEADDDNLYFASSSFSLRVHCNQVRVFFFCFSSIVFVHKFTRRSKITVALPSVWQRTVKLTADAVTWLEGSPDRLLFVKLWRKVFQMGIKWKFDRNWDCWTISLLSFLGFVDLFQVYFWKLCALFFTKRNKPLNK